MKRHINLATLFLAALLTACGGSPTKESTGEYIDDTTITTKVKAAFVKDKGVDAADVQVETFKGNVQLSGFVDSSAQIERAAQIAAKVAGVKAVRNDIRLKPAGQ